jgi:hypothetical protein
MAGLFDQLEQRKTRDENAGLALAAGKASWANQFNSIPAPEKLRANLDLTTAMDNALRRKQELLAREDLKAQELLHREKKFEQWQADAPLRTELLQRKVETEGEHERFVQRKDSEALADLSGFLGTVGRVKAKPGSPEYKAALAAALQAHPRAIGTQVGADAWKKLSAEHEDIAAITPPAGMEVDRIDIGDDGRAKAVFKPVQPASQVQVPEGMVPSGATVNKRGDVSVNYAPPKVDKPDKPEKPDTYDDFNKDLEAAKEAYKPTGGNLPPFIQKAFEERGRRLEEAVKNPTGAPASTPAVSGPVATNPKTGQKLVLRDGKWQPL